MGLDGGRSKGIPKSSSERSLKSEFSDSEFVLGGLNLTVVLTWEMGAERGMGIWGEMVIWGVERGIWGVVERGIWGEMGILGGGKGDLGGDGDVDAGDCDVEGHGEGDLGGGDLCLFLQARRVLGESGGGIGIAGESACCGEGDLGGGDLCLFPKQEVLWERVEGELVLQGNPHIVVCPCFSLDL